MSDSKIDYVRSYSTLAQQHKDGLDAIITSIGSGGSSTVTADDIIDAVVDYMETTFFGGSAGPDAEVNFKAGIANAMNGYLQNGGSSPYLRTLQSIPATVLANGFDRLADALPAARSLKGGADGAQMVQALGQADAEYWANQIATTGSWTPYLNGNAAMFGAQFSYGQLPGTDLESVSSIIMGVLSGSLAVAAGKVVFGWVPKHKIKPGVFSSGTPIKITVREGIDNLNIKESPASHGTGRILIYFYCYGVLERVMKHPSNLPQTFEVHWETCNVYPVA